MQCKYHSQPIIKIQQPSLRPLCEKCINESDGQKKFRLESMRASLNRDFNRYFFIKPSNLKQLEVQKSKIDKMIELFVGKNMTEAKKIINKKSLQAQKVVETVIERQVKKANELLKTFTTQLLEPYAQIQTLKQLEQIHFEFDEEFLELEEKVEVRKKELRKDVIEKVKEQMRNFYCQIFDLA